MTRERFKSFGALLDTTSFSFLDHIKMIGKKIPKNLRIKYRFRPITRLLMYPSCM